MRRRTRSRVRPAGGYPSDRPRGRRWWCVRRRAYAPGAVDQRQRRIGVERVVSEIHPGERVHEHAAREHRDADVRRVCGPVRGSDRTGFDVSNRKVPWASVGQRPKPKNAGSSGAGPVSSGCRYRPCALACQISTSASSIGRPTPSSTLSLDANALAVRAIAHQDVLRLRRPRQANPEKRTHGLRRCLPRQRHQRASIGVS
jgi:hypothetical protein